jgi:hypothetical protein
MPSEAALPVAGQGAGQQPAYPIERLRQRFKRHDRALAEVRRLVDADMGDRLLSEELGQSASRDFVRHTAHFAQMACELFCPFKLTHYPALRRPRPSPPWI